MTKKMLLLFLPLLFLASCQYFDKQVPSKDDLLEKELQSINWNEVDELPSVAECDSLADKTAQQQCFFQYLTQIIQQKLSSDTLSVLYPELDTIEVKVTVFPDSKLQFEPKLYETNGYENLKIDSLLQARLVDFPAVKPALKRGLPVKTQFVLPVILQVEKKIKRRR